MSSKGICPACGQLVGCNQLAFADDCNVVADATRPKDEHRKLTVPHPATLGCSATQVVSQQTGAVLETMCSGSLRPVTATTVH